MSNQGDKPRKLKKRRTTARVGGTTQSGFANRSMSDLLKQSGSSEEEKPAKGSKKDAPAEE